VAYEWVAPVATAVTGVAGVFFTWFTGQQARQQVERLADRTEHAARRQFVVEERKKAYMAALRHARLDMARTRYERKGEEAKLREVERKWPKADRVEMSIEAVLAVDAFGSAASRDLLGQWAAACPDETAMSRMYDEMAALVRTELGTIELHPDYRRRSSAADEVPAAIGINSPPGARSHG
jgi:hypothetical protein